MLNPDSTVANYSKHQVSEPFKQQTAELIAGKLTEQFGTKRGTDPENTMTSQITGQVVT